MLVLALYTINTTAKFPESDIMVKTIFRPQETVSLEHGKFFCFVLILKEI